MTLLLIAACAAGGGVVVGYGIGFRWGREHGRETLADYVDAVAVAAGWRDHEWCAPEEKASRALRKVYGCRADSTALAKLKGEKP